MEHLCLHTSPQILKKWGQFLSFSCQWCGFCTEGGRSSFARLVEKPPSPRKGGHLHPPAQRNPFLLFSPRKAGTSGQVVPVTTCAGSGGFHFGRRNVAPEETVVVVAVGAAIVPMQVCSNLAFCCRFIYSDFERSSSWALAGPGSRIGISKRRIHAH